MKTKYLVASIIRPILLSLSIILFSCSGSGSDDSPNTNNTPPPNNNPPDNTTTDNIETFSFTTNGETTKGKIYLPDSYPSNSNLPAIYLMDYKEQHWQVATDEFEKVIDAVKQKADFDALVVTREEHLDIDNGPEDYQDQYAIFNDMTSYVDSKYTSNTTRTFIARGSESGIVLMTLFLEDSETSVFDNFIATDSPPEFNTKIIEFIESGNFPQNKSNKKLHFSFSSSNDFESCDNMIKKINEAEYSWLEFGAVQFSTIYTNTYPTAFTSGIEFIF